MPEKKSMSRSNITFIVFTHNEEKRIGHIIRNFIKYGDVLLLDDGSADRTKEIAEKMGAKIVLRPKVKLAEDKEMHDFIKQIIKTDWIFWGFSDNLLPKRLLERMAEVSRQSKIKYVQMPIYTYLWGDIKNVMQKGYSPRFFMIDHVDFTDNRMHGMGKFLGTKDEIMVLPSKKECAIYHYSSYNLKKFILSHLTYAEIEAQGRFQDGRRFNFLRMLISMARYFYIYIKSGFRSGALGFLVAMSYSFFRFMMFFQLYELEHGITIEDVEKNYSKSKEELLKEIEGS